MGENAISVKSQDTISITIIGHNEKFHIKEMLLSLKWADKVIYVDCDSDDGSFELARQLGCIVFRRPNNPNLNVNKTFGIDQAKTDWIFYLDPDERISEELANEIKKTIARQSPYNAYLLNRRNHYFGRWLRYGSQYPDTQLRLFKRGCAHFPQKHVHERLKIEGKIGKLKNDLYHFPYLSISQYIQKFNFYTSYEANYLYQRGINPNYRLALLYWFIKPTSRFIRRYIFKMGFRDGWQGLFAAIFDSINYVVRYFKFIELYKTNK